MKEDKKAIIANPPNVPKYNPVRNPIDEEKIKITGTTLRIINNRR